MPRKVRTIRRQRPMPGGRRPFYIALDPAVEDWCRREAKRFGCSLSMVGNNAIAWVGNIELYDPLKVKKGK